MLQISNLTYNAWGRQFLDDASVTDVLVGAGRTWIDRGRGLEEVGAAAMDEAEARALAVRMAAACGPRSARAR